MADYSGIVPTLHSISATIIPVSTVDSILAYLNIELTARPSVQSQYSHQFQIPTIPLIVFSYLLLNTLDELNQE